MSGCRPGGCRPRITPGYARRTSHWKSFGPGFDSPRLHSMETPPRGGVFVSACAGCASPRILNRPMWSSAGRAPCETKRATAAASTARDRGTSTSESSCKPREWFPMLRGLLDSFEDAFWTRLGRVRAHERRRPRVHHERGPPSCWTEGDGATIPPCGRLWCGGRLVQPSERCWSSPLQVLQAPAT